MSEGSGAQYISIGVGVGANVVIVVVWSHTVVTTHTTTRG